ncbi:conserved Plasmodium protein, unknown function [Plasmodium knowlesi strain H]|uniref:Uncharacterized protein n=3 Tax=Plasmodium knowlesi TaxID=5850 RepID=A0A5K1U8Y6_PLAKH|nr:conserved Plasmodium protein, unknown function [Plasmodium knowlesi strain H]OTN64054.1 Uncharacterized protein PKNOH_S140263600 [Plasmodium knowlesi]CAA9991051.1 conserved Plasmodium protein, unknown function [Plasmodium knowlesi strain H]SBO20663.1 conserved Plasmodium protein, unknown function [Plasmodium knowlesi strain H]SBO21087.1 conserved Plasmodium protein, unknown function [Plasmodium knowlesi strain H]VVS80525.1 conserved Plasmodium protein, unknown function [Plasmodium knowlesi |eukprot:XP_002262333.1 hypothetical protein, conserved in Plasmodium species [Plasmodium knowlesi strain H]
MDASTWKMNGPVKSGQGRRASRPKVEQPADSEAEKKNFCRFYICDLLNMIYSTYKNTKPMYVHFVCSKERGNESEEESGPSSGNKSGRKRGNTFEKKTQRRTVFSGRKGFQYTPNSVLEQYFPEHFKNVHFLCAHYAMWANEPCNEDSKWDSLKRGNRKDGSEKQRRRGGITDSHVEQINVTYRKEQTFYFIFTFFMYPNFLWEEINIPIFHHRGYIECKFDCISNFMKLNNGVDLINRLKLRAHNQTLIQCIRGGATSGGSPNGGNLNTGILNGVNSTNQTRGDVHPLPFFISSQCLRKNYQVCLTRVISFNDRGVYCKRDQREDLPIQLLLLIQKKLHKRLKNMEREAALMCHLRRIETKGGGHTQGHPPKFVLAKEDTRKTISDFIPTIKSDDHSDGTPRSSGTRRGDLHVDGLKSNHSPDNLAGVDYEEIHKLINSAETIFKNRISDQQLEKLLLRMRNRGNAHSQTTRETFPHLPNLANIANVVNINKLANVVNINKLANVANINKLANVANINKLANVANITSIPKLGTPNKGLSPSGPNFPKDEAMDVHLGLDAYYEFLHSGKNELINTLRDSWQFGIDVNRTNKKRKIA